MVLVHRLDGKQMFVNADHILTIESLPDTILSLTTGARILVRDTPAELVERVAEFRRRCATSRPEVLPQPPPDAALPGHPEAPAPGRGQD